MTSDPLAQASYLPSQMSKTSTEGFNVSRYGYSSNQEKKKVDEKSKRRKLEMKNPGMP